MKRERELLLAVLTALRQPERAADLPADDPLLLPVARRHRLTPLLSATCGPGLPPALREAVRRDRILTAACNSLLAQVGADVVRTLQAAGVQSIILKGLDYETRLYGAAGTRPTADVDLLIPDAHRRTAFATLDSMGFEPRAAAAGFDDPDYHEVAWTRGNVEVDLHMGLAPLARCEIDYTTVWAEAIPTRLAETDALALARAHAAVFQALHMAIDHFDVPAIYLVDLAHLLRTPDDQAEALALASAWHCRRALDTALAMTAAMIPGWAGGRQQAPSWIARRIVAGYGGVAPVPRPEQLLRKAFHFDSLAHAGRYFVVQSRRNVHETIERRVRHRSPRVRLGF